MREEAEIPGARPPCKANNLSGRRTHDLHPRQDVPGISRQSTLWLTPTTEPMDQSTGQHLCTLRDIFEKRFRQQCHPNDLSLGVSGPAPSKRRLWLMLICPKKALTACALKAFIHHRISAFKPSLQIKRVSYKAY